MGFVRASPFQNVFPTLCSPSFSRRHCTRGPERQLLPQQRLSEPPPSTTLPSDYGEGRKQQRRREPGSAELLRFTRRQEENFQKSPGAGKMLEMPAQQFVTHLKLKSKSLFLCPATAKTTEAHDTAARWLQAGGTLIISSSRVSVSGRETRSSGGDGGREHVLRHRRTPELPGTGFSSLKTATGKRRCGFLPQHFTVGGQNGL